MFLYICTVVVLGPWTRGTARLTGMKILVAQQLVLVSTVAQYTLGTSHCKSKMTMEPAAIIQSEYTCSISVEFTSATCGLDHAALEGGVLLSSVGNVGCQCGK
jgi:hypothetical protein